MNNLIPINFYSDKIYLADIDGEPYVPLRPIVENMGLNWPSQYRKISGASEHWGVVMMTTPSEGGSQETLSIPLRKFFGFLLTIDSSRVKPELRLRIELYKKESEDALYKYWTQGRAVNPRGSEVIASDLVQIETIDYIRLLESENTLLRGKTKRVRVKAPITEEKIARAKELRAMGYSYRDIARELDIGPGTAYHAVNYKRKPELVN